MAVEKGGHLFIINGDITQIACDAWLLPTDLYSSVTEPFQHAVKMPLARRSWNTGNMEPYQDSPPKDGPWIWLGNIGSVPNTPVEHFGKRGGEFVNTISRRLGGASRLGRSKPLVAVPLLGSGDGGGARRRTSLCRELIPRLQAEALATDIDVVLVTRDAAAYSAAQKTRQDLVGANLDQAWDLGAHGSDLQETATLLADYVRRGELVLFMGAGASADAGIPQWQEMINRLAEETKYEKNFLDRMNSMDLRDQATILARELGEDLSTLIARLTEVKHYTLTHGLLASMLIREAVTTNYDKLYEYAVRGRRGRLTVIPGPDAIEGQSWLLKLHGSIDTPASIVLSREDYETATRRGALRGLLQAMLLTRHMLFVGYSLSDEDFHTVMSDVRIATGGGRKFGTALALLADAPFEVLWEADLNIVTMTAASELNGDSPAHAGRLVQIFLDLVAFKAADMSAFLLASGFDEQSFTPDERSLKEALTLLQASLPDHDASTGWLRVKAMLETFGLGEHT